MAHGDVRDRLLIKLPRPVSPALAGEVEKAAVYISTDLESLHVTSDLEHASLTVRPDGNAAAVQEKVGRFLHSMLANVRDIEATVHYRRQKRADAPPVSNVNEELIRRGWVFQHAPGQVSLAGPALRLIELLDARFGAIYRERFGATDRMFPAMVSSRLLSKVGYFESHPNASSFVCHMVEDFDELERFRAANAGAAFAEPTGASLAQPHRCLNPAACFPCYEAFENRTVPAGGVVLTWKGRVFRYEGRNMHGLERLWEFNVRELVFIGTDEFTLDARRRAVDLVEQLAEEWDLDCFVETAADAFFPTVFAARKFWQEIKDVKYEIRLAIEPGPDGAPRTLAAGSINLHGPFFGERFNITLPDGGPVSTACVGWGLERWVLALFSQHGFVPARWPESLREIFSEAAQ